MKPLSRLLAAGVVLFCCSFAAAGWYNVDSKEGKFKAAFPGKPEQSQKPANTPAGPIKVNLFTYNADVSEHGNRLYLLMYSDYPEAVISSTKRKGIVDTFFKNAIDGAINNIHGKIISMESSPMNKYPGRLVKASFAEGKAMMDIHFYLVKNRFYMLEVGYQKNELNAVSEKHFFNSFQLTDPK